MPSWLMVDPDSGALGPAARRLCLDRGVDIQGQEEVSSFIQLIHSLTQH